MPAAIPVTLGTSCRPPLLDGVMYLFGHPGTGDQPGPSLESQRFKMEAVYIALLQGGLWHRPYSSSFVRQQPDLQRVLGGVG